MSANDAILPILERVLKDRAQAIAITGEVVTALDLGGWITTDNDHLAIMRSTLRRVHDAVADPEVKARDLAALTNRLQALSKEVTTMEERQNQEKSGKGGSSKRDTNTASDDDTSFDPGSV